jgi:osmotically-inducible protein OsmY
MKKLKTYALLASFAGALAIGGLTGCETTKDERSAGRAIDDEEINHNVKEGLRDEVVYKFNDVDVRTFGGVVQLSGFVNTEEQKQRAGEIAQETKGVAQVVNNITLKPQIPTTPTGRTQ